MVTIPEVTAKMHDASQGFARGAWSVAISYRSDLGYGLSAQAGAVIYRASGRDLESAFVALFAKLPPVLPSGGG